MISKSTRLTCEIDLLDVHEAQQLAHRQACRGRFHSANRRSA
jgi:hypothetical protein